MYGKMVLTQDVSIHSIQYDSRKVGHGDLFVAIAGTAADGHAFVESAIDRGAVAVVMQNDQALPDPFFQHAGVVKIVVPDSRKALARMSANFYGHPSRKLRLIGVTGTNGKTTTTHLIRSILEADGMKVGLIGTIGYMIGEESLPATHTTPESLELNELLAHMVSKGCTAAVMEVSSHSLALSRVFGLEFSGACVTNLTQDHLDFHGTMDEYFNAKRVLFERLSSEACAVSNADDPYGAKMLEGTAARKLTYSRLGPADVQAHDVRMSVAGMKLAVAYKGKTQEIESRLTGRFNVENILAAYTTGLGLGIAADRLRTGIFRLPAVRGRFEQIVSPAGWTAVIDYAHTPDALEKCLRTIRDLLPTEKPGRIITVFGCGGNRDRGKRPKMGRIASELSDITVVTSDNPRKELPGAIIDEVMAGVQKGTAVHREEDRRAAIGKALAMARPGDVVLIAGKGHEDYQVIGEQKHHFDDREEVENIVRKMK
ncbi:UDP-N-acetylmuramoyl-L-alanyl-D-glutamate--2,6-diaminopimelate ligase [bacterium]|nr:MAG: UDP-N-acetylmuramoyl-L-alanyl-D-glutamate--2,6-diaminopimelate ligase [bacterium]